MCASAWKLKHILADRRPEAVTARCPACVLHTARRQVTREDSTEAMTWLYLSAV